MGNRFYDHLKDLISVLQHGFLPNRSCVTQLLLVLHTVGQSLDNNIQSDMIYLDFAKAFASSETQGQSVGSGKKAGRKFSSKGGRAPGYRLSPNYFQKFKRMPAPDWAQKMLCIVPNRRRVSPEFFS